MEANRHLDSHLRLCGASNWKTSLVFLLFSAQWIVVAWRQLGSASPTHRAPVTSLALYGGAAIVLGWLMTELTCLRERVVLALGLSRFGMDLLTGVVPSLPGSVVLGARALSLAMSLGAALVSLALLCSALRGRRHTRVGP